MHSGRVTALHDDGFDLAPSIAAESRSLIVFRRGETAHARFQSGKFDHDETVEFLWSFHDLVAPTASQDLTAMLADDRGDLIGILLVFDRIVDFRPCNPDRKSVV